MEDVIVATLNLSKICRVCLAESESDTMHSIYSQLQMSDGIEDEIPCIYEILMTVSEIKVDTNDGLPNMICTNCIQCAENSYKFQKQCNRSQAILDAYLLQAKELEEQKKSAEHAHLLPSSVLSQINDSDDTNDETNTTFVPLELVLIENSSSSQPDIVGTEMLSMKEVAPLQDDDELDLKIESENMHVENDAMLPCLADDDISDSDVTKSFSLESITNDDSEPFIDEIECKKVTSDVKNTFRPGLKWMKTDSGEKLYACTSCNKTYKHSGSLRIHMRIHNDEKPYVCSECGKGYKQHTSLVYHSRGHTGERPYTCKLCGKKYRQSSTLTAHMRVHTGQRPYLCSICGRGFRQAPDLTYHMRTHTKERPYMCNICGKTMTMQCHLVQHMRSHTGERPFQCNVCNKAFPSSTRLKRHAIIHTGLKPYTCDVCDKSFNRSSSLRVHSKIHTDERPHVCPICNKGFIQAHALKSHIITHSAEISKQLAS